MLVHLDCVGGIAGDMFLAACVHTWPDLADGVEDAMRAAGLPPTWRVNIQAGHSFGLAGTRVTLRGPDPDEDHIHSGDHTGSWREIRQRLEGADLRPGVRDRALDIFERLAIAEADAHGVSVDEVHFHELADWDSVADIVGAAFCIDSIDATGWSVGPLPMGGGTVATNHGPLPIPVPAVVNLLAGYPMVDDGIGGERVTPTGAAILAHLQARPGSVPSGTIEASGHGLGTRDLRDRANLLRLVAVQPATSQEVPAGWRHGTVTVVTFDVDDQTPEDLAVGLDALRAVDGVLDVTQMTVHAKKGRLSTRVQILCSSEERDVVIAACFAQTTTIGLRWHVQERAELARHSVTQGDIDAKAATRPDGTVTIKPEMDSIAAVTNSQVERSRARTRFALDQDQA
jgi:pyridinium-3,5-bisthiocarboxylic acid mononucleotide nickel chelatase